MSSLDTISIGDDVGEYACMGVPYVAVEYLQEVCDLLIERSQ